MFLHRGGPHLGSFVVGPFIRHYLHVQLCCLLSFGLFFVLICHEFAEALVKIYRQRGEPCEDLAHHRSSASPGLAESESLYLAELM